jgi:hypothetical protein
MTEDTILQQYVTREVKKLWHMCPKEQNPVLSIIRFHLLTEYSMERIFNLVLPRGDKIADSSLTYAQKISLLEALAIVEDQTIQCLKNLNRVRNRCAHESEKEITGADLELIGNLLGKEHVKIRRSYDDDTQKYLHSILSSIYRNITKKIWELENAQLPKDESTENQPEN